MKRGYLVRVAKIGLDEERKKKKKENGGTHY